MFSLFTLKYDADNSYTFLVYTVSFIYGNVTHIYY
jgi:hypothetical protein